MTDHRSFSKENAAKSDKLAEEWAKKFEAEFEPKLKKLLRNERIKNYTIAFSASAIIVTILKKIDKI